MGLLDRLTSLVRANEPSPLPLRFELDERDDGKHVVTFTADLPSGSRAIPDPAALLDYGSSIEIDGRTFRPSVEHMETIWALHSLNPTPGTAGEWVFDISPPVLAYLRDNDSVIEGPASRKLEIGGAPATPVVTVDYAAGAGATIEAGYDFGDGRLIPANHLDRTADGGFVRIANRFAPIIEPAKAAQPWLSRQKTIISPGEVPSFFLHDLAVLRGVTATRLSAAANAVEVEESGAPQFQIDNQVPGWLDFTVSYGSGDLTIPLETAAEAAAAGEAYVEAAPGKFLKIDPDAIEGARKSVDELGAEQGSDGRLRVPAARVGQLQDVIADLGGNEQVAVAYREFLAALTGLTLDPEFRLPELIEAELSDVSFALRPYQRQGIQWIRWLSKQALHGLLADDMGLGKTVQTVLAVRASYDERPGDPPLSMVVCPRSVVENWAREFRKLFPEIEVDIHLGNNRELADFERTTSRLFITSYGTLTRDADHLAAVDLRYLILDEASQIKNPSAQRTKALKRLRARHRLCLTGTPVENRPSELWSLYDFLLPGHLGDRRAFDRTFGDPLVSGDVEAAAKLSDRIRPFLLRRKKEDVAKDLPEKIEVRAWCELTLEQARLYQAVLDGSADIVGALQRGDQVSMTTSILPILTRLKQVCDHPALLERGAPAAVESTVVDVAATTSTPMPTVIAGRSEKFDLVLERIEEIAARAEKTIVFSQFLGMLDLLERALRERGIAYVRIDGATTDRQVLIDRLNTDAAVKVALCSILATGYGINLQAANNVVHVDRWWNPATEDQATARVHRIGQLRSVVVHHILVKGTLEERIDWLLQRKREMATGIVDGGADAELGWTQEELLEILRPVDVAASLPTER